ncbi:hypothetical protein KOI40_04000 [Aestuariicella sp. G3-2]|nr:hypothetical protein [Aestuariicella albida]
MKSIVMSSPKSPKIQPSDINQTSKVIALIWSDGELKSAQIGSRRPTTSARPESAKMAHLLRLFGLRRWSFSQNGLGTTHTRPLAPQQCRQKK